MKAIPTALFFLSTAALLPVVASAQQQAGEQQPVQVGQREYMENCAVCHGEEGKGDGPLAGMITERVADLTTLSRQNNGVFPFDRVYQVIDGREMPAAHGTRDMPVWGNEFNAQAVEYYADYPFPYSAEGFVRGRILALTHYIFELQEAGQVSEQPQ